MDALTKRQSAVLDVLDAQISELEEKLERVQPLINELNKLKQTRRTLLSEKSVTGGAGNSNAQLTQEMVIQYLKANEDVKPDDIAQHYGVKGEIVRSHLNRHKNNTYERNTDGTWGLIDTGEEL
jgi:TolA-binding protein